MKMLILTEEDWFDRYYPKEWGNWREYYNIEAYRKNKHLSGCTWLNYIMTGYVLSEDDKGLMKINKRGSDSYIRSSLFQVSIDVYMSIGGFEQPDNTYWVHGEIYKHESNLKLYTIRLFGCDDTSYSKDFVGLYSVLKGWDKVPYVLSDWPNLKKEEYYFTN